MQVSLIGFFLFYYYFCAQKVHRKCTKLAVELDKYSFFCSAIYN